MCLANIHDRFTVVNMSVTVGKVALTCVSLHMHVLVCFFFFFPSIPDGYTWLKGGSGVPYRQIVYVGLSLISEQDGKHL